ncbi:MAG: DUF4097 family beta strand repeat-containing protein [Terriglobia bacterium]|jgi:DUF4097 and DUF4098 domain-containing protein YvlB|nr:DUF4097 family beta strand repeat-containing protein [Terriglobia bacterium]
MPTSRKATLWGVLLGVTLAVALASLPAHAGVTEEFHKTYPISPDGRISVKNLNGAVTVVAWDKNEVQIDAMKTGDTKELVDEAKIEVTAGSSAIDVRTHYPEDRHNYHAATVDYTLHVPRRGRLDKIELVNGRVSIQGVQGGIRASSVNGEVEAREVAGDMNLQSVNGRVLADMRAPARSVELGTVNGQVALKIPSDASAEINASTVHGNISNDFNIPVNHGHFAPGSELRARLGKGETRMKLSTVNGGIEIQRAPDGKPLGKVTNLLPEDKGRYY